MYSTQYLEVGQRAFDQSFDSQDKHLQTRLGISSFPLPSFFTCTFFFLYISVFLAGTRKDGFEVEPPDVLQILPFLTPNQNTRTCLPDDGSLV